MNIVKFQRRERQTAEADESRQLCREVERFREAWPGEPTGAHRMPDFTWEQLERQLIDLAGTQDRADLATPLVSALRKQAPWKPPEMLLREVLCLAWTLMDEAFQPGTGHGEEGEMP